MVSKRLVIICVGCITVGIIIGYVLFEAAGIAKSIEKEKLDEGVIVLAGDDVKVAQDKKENNDLPAQLEISAIKENKAVGSRPDGFATNQEIPEITTSELKPNLSDESNGPNNLETPVKGRRQPNQPPGVDKDDSPLSMLAQINGFVAESKRTAGPNANQMGEQLLDSTNSLLRVAGAAVLAANDGLTDEILKKIATDDNLSVSLNSLGWLSDTGYGDASKLLNKQLSERGVTKENLLDLIVDGDLNSSGSRLALEMISGSVTLEEAQDIYGSVGADATMAYSIRMKALLELKKKMNFVDYRDTVNQLNNSSSADDAVWQEGIKRLAESLVGPVSALSGPATVTPDGIDEALAREYPMTLEDLAQKLENVVSSNDSYVQEGTTTRLEERLEELNNRPWTEEQQISLNRINAIIEQLKAKEEPVTEAPANFAEPPPGAGS